MAEPDLEFLRKRVRELERRAEAGNIATSLAPGGSGPHDPGMAERVAKLEADVGHIRSDISEIKAILGRLAPRIDEMYGKLSFFATKEDIANLKLEIEKRPTRRQSVLDILYIVTIVTGVMTFGSKLLH
jgi:hypothetical protein